MILDYFHPGEVPRPPAGEAHGKHPYALYVKALRAAMRQLVAAPVDYPVDFIIEVHTRRAGSLSDACATITDATEGIVIVERWQVAQCGYSRMVPTAAGPGVRLIVTKAEGY
jgi:hypothetical protein